MAKKTTSKSTSTETKADDVKGVNGQAGANGTGGNVPLPLFYKKIVLLNKEEHGDIKLKPMDDYSFAKKANSIVLAASEIPQAAGSYPIVFGKAGEGLMVFAVTGHTDGSNVFVGNDNKWRAGCYIPAYVRRYPFLLVQSADASSYSLAADESSSLLDRKDGKALYENGAPSEVAKRALAFSMSFSKEMDRTVGLLKQLEDSGILVERSAEVTLDGKKTTRIVGFSVVDERKLAELDDKKFLEMRKSGLLNLIYCHLWSMRGWNNLLDEAKA